MVDFLGSSSISPDLEGPGSFTRRMPRSRRSPAPAQQPAIIPVLESKPPRQRQRHAVSPVPVLPPRDLSTLHPAQKIQRPYTPPRMAPTFEAKRNEVARIIPDSTRAISDGIKLLENEGFSTPEGSEFIVDKQDTINCVKTLLFMERAFGPDGGFLQISVSFNPTTKDLFVSGLSSTGASFQKLVTPEDLTVTLGICTERLKLLFDNTVPSDVLAPSPLDVF